MHAFGFLDVCRAMRIDERTRECFGHEFREAPNSRERPRSIGKFSRNACRNRRHGARVPTRDCFRCDGACRASALGLRDFPSHASIIKRIIKKTRPMRTARTAARNRARGDGVGDAAVAELDSFPFARGAALPRTRASSKRTTCSTTTDRTASASRAHHDGGRRRCDRQRAAPSIKRRVKYVYSSAEVIEPSLILAPAPWPPSVTS